MRLSNQAVERLRDVATLPQLPEGRYAITRRIGRGGMGTVYVARDHLLDRDVAIKVSNAPRVESALEDHLRREALVLASLEHPGIVPVHDAGRLDDGRMFYVMKLVNGRTLTEHASHLTTEAARLSVFERLVETVAFAHAARVVHRDIKPSNVMIGRFGEVLVLDWGVARRLGARDQPGLLVGTPGFMSPEQARGDDSVDAATDVYALGAILFWLLVGETPVAAHDANRRRLRSVSGLSRRLRAVVLHCLSPEPSRRYASASQLAVDILQYRAGHPVVAHPEHVFERIGRSLHSYRTFIVLVAAYLLMRTLFAFWLNRS